MIFTRVVFPVPFSPRRQTRDLLRERKARGDREAWGGGGGGDRGKQRATRKRTRRRGER